MLGHELHDFCREDMLPPKEPYLREMGDGCSVRAVDPKAVDVETLFVDRKEAGLPHVRLDVPTLDDIDELVDGEVTAPDPVGVTGIQLSIDLLHACSRSQSMHRL